jgi:hypothetical protein
MLEWILVLAAIGTAVAVFTEIAWPALRRLAKRAYEKAKQIAKVIKVFVRVIAKQIAISALRQFFFGPAFEYLRAAAGLNAYNEVIDGIQESFSSISDISDEAIRSSVERTGEWYNTYSVS